MFEIMKFLFCDFSVRASENEQIWQGSWLIIDFVKRPLQIRNGAVAPSENILTAAGRGAHIVRSPHTLDSLLFLGRCWFIIRQKRTFGLD